MSRWLLKEEPTHYAFADLVRDGRTEWDGVHNPLALRHLRSMVVGDEAFYYHSGGERAAVGIVRISRGPRPDPSDPRPTVSVEIAPVRALRRAIGLAELKEDPALARFDLFRIGRLSVVPVSDAQWARILAHEGETPVGATGTPGRRLRPAARAQAPPRGRRRSKRATGSAAASRAPARRTAHGTGD